MPQKARRLARNSAILLKLQANDVRVVDNLAVDAPKTKVVAQMYKALGIDRSCLFAVAERNENLEKSARNIDRTTLIGPPGQVKERIAALREAGVTHLQVNPVGTDIPKLISTVKEWIS